jgi:hypothetical protein
MVVVHSWIEEFVCLFGLWADIRSLTDSPRVLITYRKTLVLDGALTLIYKLGLSCAKLYQSLN